MGLLNYQTILSSYDDKLTLMQWLKKVEAALNNAAAVAFNVNKRGDATLTFSIVFEDGSELESGPIVLQQGESVESAAIVGGHLLLTLTNGDVLDAGGLFNGDVNVTGNVTATGNISATGNVRAAGLEATGTGVETGVITASGASLDIFAPVVNLNNSLAAQGAISSEDEISTPVITSDASEIEARKPIVETMSGYSFVKDNSLEWNEVYVSACKNGNKLTLVVFGDYTKRSSDNNGPICGFFVPAAIWNKLYPYTIGALTNGLSHVNLPMWSNRDGNIEITGEVVKGSNPGQLIFNFLSISRLTNDITYLFRWEITFLLSENLAA